MCQYWACTGPMRPASAQYRPSTGTYQHVYRVMVDTKRAPMLAESGNYPVNLMFVFPLLHSIILKSSEALTSAYHSSLLPFKQAMCQHRAGTGPMLAASAQYRPVLAHNGMIIGQW